MKIFGQIIHVGTSLVPFQNIYSNASFFGPTNSRSVNHIVSNTSTGILNNLVISDKVIKDNEIPASQITTNTNNLSTLQTKTQNQSATAGNTNFTGILQQVLMWQQLQIWEIMSKNLEIQ